MQNGTTILGECLEVPYKANHVLTIQSSNHIPRYLPQQLKTWPHKKLHTGTYSSLPRHPSVGECINCDIVRY
jgi:hypothetical protein